LLTFLLVVVVVVQLTVRNSIESPVEKKFNLLKVYYLSGDPKQQHQQQQQQQQQQTCIKMLLTYLTKINLPVNMDSVRLE
jgi:type VI protein secretion system component VasK